jgi:hypothetical protein
MGASPGNGVTSNEVDHPHGKMIRGVVTKVTAQLVSVPAPHSFVAPVFSLSGCETVAPVTHQDQAKIAISCLALTAFAVAEKRWYRHASQ